MLHKAGTEGWELVVITINNIAYLKQADRQVAAKAENLNRLAATTATAIQTPQNSPLCS